jgi:hypothetical protein
MAIWFVKVGPKIGETSFLEDLGRITQKVIANWRALSSTSKRRPS